MGPHGGTSVLMRSGGSLTSLSQGTQGRGAMSTQADGSSLEKMPQNGTTCCHCDLVLPGPGTVRNNFISSATK